MKVISKTVSCLAIAGSLLAGSTAMAAQDPWVNGASSTTASWLYVIESSAGKLVHDSGRRYHLVVPTEKIKSVLAFTDRPYRKASRISLAEYVKQVHMGLDSFDVDPPNMVLSWADKSHAAQAYEIASATKGRHAIRYKLTALTKGLSTSKEIKGAFSLFIDDSVVDTETAYTSYADCQGRNPTGFFLTDFFYTDFYCMGWAGETYTQVTINGRVVN